jgi:hypothetical protein
MYIREKTITRGLKTYSYYQLVESTWEAGKSRQKVLKHLGRCPGREHADMIARQQGLLCSVLECGREGADERRQRDLRVRLCAEHAALSEDGETLRVYPMF